MNVSRRWFIGGAASLGAFQGCRFMESAAGRDGVARLKFGVVSDIHIIAENTDRSFCGNTRTFTRALRWYDAQGVDGVLIAGDMADAGLISQLQCVADAWNAVFPGGRSKLDGRPVEKIFVYGNHDWEGFGYRYNIFGHSSKELVADHIRENGMKKVWEEVFEEEYSPVYRKVIKGYTFVGGHWDAANGSGWGRCPNIVPFFDKHGREIDPNLPFFYVQHPHPKDTCYGSWAWGHDHGLSTRVLSKYPNAIAFSGHSHYSLLDERSIWQGAFTSIGTGSLRYTGEPYDEFTNKGGYENVGGRAASRVGKIDRLMAKSDKTLERNGMLVAVYDDHITITRRDFRYDCDLGPDWVMPLPVAESKPFAFAEHAKSLAVPQFAAGAELKAERAPYPPEDTAKKGGKNAPKFDVFNLTIPAAQQTFSNRVWRYEVQVVLKKDESITLTRNILSPDYHLPLEKAAKELLLPVPVDDLPKGEEFRFTVLPCNCFDRAGRALSTAWLTA